MPCLNSAYAVTWNNPRFWTLEVDIVSNARVSEFLTLAVPALMLSEPRTLLHTVAILLYFASWREDILQSRLFPFCSFRINFICCLHLRDDDKIKFKPFSAQHQVTWVRFHWNYIFISNIMKGATANLKLWLHYLNIISVCVVFQK